ncbi:MAG: amidohydrolase family protein, partial [Desulfobacteraceae bacterium]|nr:amidohydrolase family protein [Desulfobacteraceae bacterium]
MNFKSGYRKLGFFVLLLCLFSLILSSDSDRNDLLKKNTKIVDGTGKAAYKGNIAIKGDKIVRVGKFKGEADVVIDGSGFVTCPGFIDPHSHADHNIMKYPLAENLIMQGITTVVGGNCGNSPAPRKNLTFGQFISNLEKKGISINFALLVGHNVIRSLVMGDDFKREATREEIEKMKKYVEDAMQNGSFGLSAGLDYYPGEYAGEEEI